MTTIALNTANRSFSMLGTFIDALDKAIRMAKAIRHDHPSADDVKRIRVIAETI